MNVDNKIVLVFLILILLIYFFYKQTEYFTNNVKINKIYAINLDESIERFNHLKQKAKKFNLNVNRFVAINGKKVNIFEKEKELNLKISKTLKKGNLGCALSHYTLIKSLKNSKDDYVLILEDDVIFDDKFHNINKILNKIDFDFDMLFLGGCNIYGSLFKKDFIKPRKHLNQGLRRYNMCLHAYIVNIKNIDNILNSIKKINKPIDIIIRDNIDNLKMYYLKKPLVYQDRNYNSVLQSFNKNKFSMPKKYQNIDDVTII